MIHRFDFSGGRFPLGQLTATPGAVGALQGAKQSALEFVVRHVRGDWGELEDDDVRENEFSLEHGSRLLSSYKTRTGDQLWIITEADRSRTTLLLPNEY